MRATVDLDDELVLRARDLTGIQETTALIQEALRALVSREVSRRLIALGGTMPMVQAGRRRRSAKSR